MTFHNPTTEERFKNVKEYATAALPSLLLDYDLSDACAYSWSVGVAMEECHEQIIKGLTEGFPKIPEDTPVATNLKVVPLNDS